MLLFFFVLSRRRPPRSTRTHSRCPYMTRSRLAVRPRGARDGAAEMQRDPALLREAAAGRSGPMIEARAQEARARADPNLRADRFVERWQGRKPERDRRYRGGAMGGREPPGTEMAGMEERLLGATQVEIDRRHKDGRR